MNTITKPTTILELYTNAQKWTKYSYGARKPLSPNTIEEDKLESYNPEATCWCLTGAMSIVYPERKKQLEVSSKLRDIIDKLFPQRISSYFKSDHPRTIMIAFNDHKDTTFEDILKVVKEANV